MTLDTESLFRNHGQSPLSKVKTAVLKIFSLVTARPCFKMSSPN